MDFPKLNREIGIGDKGRDYDTKIGIHALELTNRVR